MSKRLAIILWFLIATLAFGQGQDSIRAVSGVLTINLVPSATRYKVFVDQTITSTVFNNPIPTATITVLFVQDSTGHTVAFGGNISGGCTVTSTASATTACQFTFDSANNQWTALAGGGGGSSFIAKNGIDATASKYALNADTKWVNDATFTNGANTISCPNSNCNFTSADAGKICYGTNLSSDQSILLAAAATLPQGTLTVTGAQSATCGGNWTGSTLTAGAVFVWGHDDTTPLASAWTDAVASCLPLYLPSGSMLVQSAEFNANSTNDNCILDRTSGYGALGVVGTGFGLTRLLPTPNFSASSCTGGQTTIACFFGSTGIQVMNLAIWGAGQASIGAGFNGKTGALMIGQDAITNGNSYWYNVGLLAWGAQTTGFTGLTISTASNMKMIGVTEDGMGATGCNLGSGTGVTTIDLVDQICGVNLGPAVQWAGNIESFGGVYGWISSTSTNAILTTATGGTFASFGDLFSSINFQALASGVGVIAFNSVSGNPTFAIKGGSIVNQSNTGGTLAFNLFNHGNVTIEDSIISSTAASTTLVSVCSTCSFISEGNNQFLGAATTTFSLTAGGVYLPAATDTYSSPNTTNILPTLSPTTGFNTGTMDTTPAGDTTFTVTVGTGTANSTGTIALAPAKHGWVCSAQNQTRADVIQQTANTATSCTLTNFGATSPLAATNWTNSDVLVVTAAPR